MIFWFVSVDFHCALVNITCIEIPPKIVVHSFSCIVYCTSRTMEGLEESMAFVQQRMQSVMSNFASPDDMGKVLGTPAAAKELPKSEQVWIVALHTEHVADGWTESMAVCRLVEQEKPSSELGVIMEQLKGITTEDSLRLLFEAVVSSCNKPMLYGQQPCRPKHVLLLVESEAKALKKVCDLFHRICKLIPFVF